ncbi:NAD-dependent deacetylase [Salinibacterium sp. SYSU T00001]|uniref:Sir2 family NAD-dependent protein deacetylase n=1 Tax=Homoserinimonas sedimenticola TaxID=2986805 RepID=UPI00223673E5|nr:Sir2 family NAD-dependent protein deacetylase [Salinibacterium sedimenticola]MCW4384430.1 NAD-dependent deacetylase [Salinibacterium sedimenticola]
MPDDATVQRAAGQRNDAVPTPPGQATKLAAQIEAAVSLIRGRRLAVLTGAGVSTDSGIPDYRGEGAPARSPMTFSQFLESEAYRRRYWAGSHLGWRAFSAASPNPGHDALARLEAGGVSNGVITQNVDGLHLRAGSAHVVDLHGSMDRVRCLDCGQFFARTAIAETIVAANPWLEQPGSVELGPDGDVAPGQLAHFTIPQCTVCGGTLKPDVVFFGEFVPVERFAEARALVQSADVLLVAGSSLVVNSGVRLLEAAHRRKAPVIIVNRGVTKGDGRAALKIDAGTTPTLVGLAERLLT